MSTIASGVIQRFGNGQAQSGFEIWPGRTQREVHPTRRDESISYRIESDDTKAQPRTVEGWEHYSYRFTYRYLGRTLTVAWHCGTAYGEPKPLDGLEAIFKDISTVEYEAFGEGWAADYGLDGDMRKAQRMYDACERMVHRADAFFDNAEEQTLWRNILEGIEGNPDLGFTITVHEAREVVSV